MGVERGLKSAAPLHNALYFVDFHLSDLIPPCTRRRIGDSRKPFHVIWEASAVGDRSPSRHAASIIRPRKGSLTLKMINAVLVFNNSGQPRLTKFYTQLVRLPGLESVVIEL